MQVVPRTKICSQCGNNFPIECFYRKQSKSENVVRYDKHCKSCKGLLLKLRRSFVNLAPPLGADRSANIFAVHSEEHRNQEPGKGESNCLDPNEFGRLVRVFRMLQKWRDEEAQRHPKRAESNHKNVGDKCVNML